MYFLQIKRIDDSHEAWQRRAGRIFLSWALFNPNGPTLWCLGLLDGEEPTEGTPFYRMLHFATGEARTFGGFSMGTREADQDIDACFRTALRHPGERMLTAIPSIVTYQGPDQAVDQVPFLLAESAAIQNVTSRQHGPPILTSLAHPPRGLGDYWF